MEVNGLIYLIPFPHGCSLHVSLEKAIVFGSQLSVETTSKSFIQMTFLDLVPLPHGLSH